MRFKQIDKELESIQIELDRIGEQRIMSSTSTNDSFGSNLRRLAFRIGYCRAAIKNRVQDHICFMNDWK